MEIPESAIREFILAGHPPKTAIAMAIAKSRKPVVKADVETTDEPDLATEPTESAATDAERVVQASSISDAAKAAILARKQKRDLK